MKTTLLNYVNLKTKKSRWFVTIVIVLLVLAAYLFYRGFFVAATVNGSPISRIEVIGHLEKQNGKIVLDSLITEVLITNEAKDRGIVIDEAEVIKEIEVIESQITAEGSTLEEKLKEQGMSRDELVNNISINLKIEKLLADQTKVSEEEINSYISSQAITLPVGQEAEIRGEIGRQIQMGKLGQLFDQYIADLRSQAKIKYYVNY